MKVVDAQPGIIQQPNLERAAQLQATGPAVAQQAFAQQLQRMGALRPEQVQAAQAGSEAHPAGVRAEERGDRSRRRPQPGAARERRRVAPESAGSSTGPARLDVRV